MKLEDLKGKRVLVTGASSGIGAATAIAFAKQGCKVGVHYNRNKEGVANVLQMVNQKGDGMLFQCDVTDEDAVVQMIDDFANWCDGIDILINNAGALLKRSTIEESTSNYVDQLYAINLRSIFIAGREALPHLKKSKGTVVNIGSIAGHSGGAGGSGIYATMKGAINTATIAMAKEFAPYGIRVNNVLPGFIDTPFHDGVTSEEQRKTFIELTPLGRIGEAEDVANAVLFLASDAASYITGETLAVNGGALMRS